MSTGPSDAAARSKVFDRSDFEWPLDACFRFLSVGRTVDVRDRSGRFRYVVAARGLLPSSELEILDSQQHRLCTAALERGAPFETLYPLRSGGVLLGTLRFVLPHGGAKAIRQFIDADGVVHRFDAPANTWIARRSNGVPLLRLSRKAWSLRSRYVLEATAEATAGERALWLPAMLTLVMIMQVADPAVPQSAG